QDRRDRRAAPGDQRGAAPVHGHCGADAGVSDAGARVRVTMLVYGEPEIDVADPTLNTDFLMELSERGTVSMGLFADQINTLRAIPSDVLADGFDGIHLEWSIAELEEQFINDDRAGDRLYLGTEDRLNFRSLATALESAAARMRSCVQD